MHKVNRILAIADEVAVEPLHQPLRQLAIALAKHNGRPRIAPRARQPAKQ